MVPDERCDMDIYSVLSRWEAIRLPLREARHHYLYYHDYGKIELPLHVAVSEGRLEETITLIDLGADVNGLESGMTPLHLAAMHGRTAIVSALLGAGADIEARDRDGRTPLFLASEFGSIGGNRCADEGGCTDRSKSGRDSDD